MTSEETLRAVIAVQDRVSRAVGGLEHRLEIARGVSRLVEETGAATGCERASARRMNGLRGPHESIFGAMPTLAGLNSSAADPGCGET